MKKRYIALLLLIGLYLTTCNLLPLANDILLSQTKQRYLQLEHPIKSESLFSKGYLKPYCTNSNCLGPCSRHIYDIRLAHVSLEEIKTAYQKRNERLYNPKTGVKNGLISAFSSKNFHFHDETLELQEIISFLVTQNPSSTLYISIYEEAGPMYGLDKRCILL